MCSKNIQPLVRSRCQGGVAAAAFLFLLSGGSRVAHAALWESPDWVLRGNAEGRIIYDSDVFGNRNGGGDTIAALTPSLTLERRNSLTQLDFQAQATIRRFFDHSSENGVDSGLSVVYSYPNSDQDLHRQQAEVHARREQVADLDIGERLRRTDVGGSWEGQIYDTGKTKLLGVAALNQYGYNRDEAKNRAGSLGLLVGYDPRELVEVSGGLNYVFDRYDPGASGQLVRERKGYGLIARIRGELSPKVTGRISGGVTRSTFTNTGVGDSTDWTAQAELDWEQSARRHVRGTFGRATYFATDGGLSVSTALSLRLVQDIAGGYSAEIRSRLATVSRKQAGDFSYDVIGVGVSGRYDLTGRVVAEVGGDYERRGNGIGSGSFDWFSTFVSCGYRF